MRSLTLSIIFLTSLLVSVSNAQFFPRTGDADKIESETKDAEEIEKVEIEKLKKLEEIKKKSEERIKEFEIIRKELRKQYYSDVNSKESKETLATLMNSNVSYWRARIFFHSTNSPKSLGSIKAVMKEDESMFNMNGSAAMLYGYVTMCNAFEAEEINDKIERKTEKEIKSLLEKYLPFEEKKSKEFTRYQQSRATRLASLKLWLSSYLSNVKTFKNLRKEIINDSFNCRPIWQMVKLLKDKLMHPLKAQEWLDVLAAKFPNEPHIILGFDKAYYYQLLGESGRIQGAITGLKELKTKIEYTTIKFRQKKDDVLSKMRDKKLAKEDLDSDEIALIDANLEDLLAEIGKYTNQLVDHFIERKDYLNNFKNSNNMGAREYRRFLDRFNRWANDLPGW